VTECKDCGVELFDASECGNCAYHSFKAWFKKNYPQKRRVEGTHRAAWAKAGKPDIRTKEQKKRAQRERSQCRQERTREGAREKEKT